MTGTLSQHLLTGLVGGLAGFAHCLGMCGPFLLRLSGSEQDRNYRPLCWLVGKLFSYLFLGASAGFTGFSLVAFHPELSLLQRLLGYLTGAAFLAAGLHLLGLKPGAEPRGGLLYEVLGSIAGRFLVTPGPTGALLLGVCSGLLPCPIVLAFLAYALHSGSVAVGMATFAGLGLGTSLPLVVLGSLAQGPALRRLWRPKAGAVLLVLLGIVTLLRGSALFHHLFGCTAHPTAHTPAASVSDCCQKDTHAPNN
ncbi:cytochrome biogenesis protein [Geomonas limicola]|uniref:Cytochrome biogenesis protein n=1 Tax=Geomonas limicola TaxID=2740186 RepID=A0A6V8N5I0_9BACT|nr:sulfite exporter TauE/SafE family protein [Geomonas limicola]GFO67640.1 cytochrome biogenesis protein [Geomonas limicola]